MKWFAWHPVKLDDGRTAWLRNVDRYIAHLHWFGGDYGYRELQSK